MIDISLNKEQFDKIKDELNPLLSRVYILNEGENVAIFRFHRNWNLIKILIEAKLCQQITVFTY